MAINAKIEAVRHKATKHVLVLKPRVFGEVAGRRILHVTKNPDYVPQVGDEIWGNAHECRIGQHAFRRIMQLWDGTEQVL